MVTLETNYLHAHDDQLCRRVFALDIVTHGLSLGNKWILLFFSLTIRMMSSLIREKAFVNGEWVGAKSGKTFSVTNPSNGAVVANVPDMDANDTQAAIDAAHKVRK